MVLSPFLHAPHRSCCAHCREGCEHSATSENFPSTHSGELGLSGVSPHWPYCRYRQRTEKQPSHYKNRPDYHRYRQHPQYAKRPKRQQERKQDCHRYRQHANHSIRFVPKAPQEVLEPLAALLHGSLLSSVFTDTVSPASALLHLATGGA